jgi:hypothetical protein
VVTGAPLSGIVLLGLGLFLAGALLCRAGRRRPGYNASAPKQR